MRLLHIVDVYGGGLASAIEEYVASTPEVSHHLLRRAHLGDFLAEHESVLFDSVAPLGDGPRRSVRDIRATIARLRPDVVHTHSSIAGALVRAISSPARRYRLVHTPHCYAFERRDVGVGLRSAFWVAEAALSRNVDVIAACSLREEELARQFRRRAETVFVPNIVKAEVSAVERRGEPGGVVGLGRLTPQKDARFFATVAQALHEQAPDLPIRWIGGGDEADAQRLAAEGVEVTGWLPRDDVLRWLRSAAVYVHTALWEGFPMALLEANALRIPVVARSIPALSDAPAESLAAAPAVLAGKILDLLGSPERSARNLEAWDEYLSLNNRRAQRRALLAAYGLGDARVTGATP